MEELIFYYKCILNSQYIGSNVDQVDLVLNVEVCGNSLSDAGAESLNAAFFYYFGRFTRLKMLEFLKNLNT